MKSTTTPPDLKARLIIVGAAMMLLGCWLAYAIQTAGGIRIQDVRFTGTNGTEMSGLLYIPPN
ncbi:MAG: hypothetical protein P8045_17150, partial [Candidatus Thiodiazotropha sp.]